MRWGCLRHQVCVLTRRHLHVLGRFESAARQVWGQDRPNVAFFRVSRIIYAPTSSLTVFAETAEMELRAGGGMGDVADEIKSSCARSNLLVHRGERPEQRRGFAAARAARKGRSRWRWLIAGALCYAAPLLTPLRAAGAEMPRVVPTVATVECFQKHGASLAWQDGRQGPSAEDATRPVRTSAAHVGCACSSSARAPAWRVSTPSS